MEANKTQDKKISLPAIRESPMNSRENMRSDGNTTRGKDTD